MLSAEAASRHENARRQNAYQARVRNSLVAATTLPWDPNEVHAGESKGKRSSVMSQSVHFQQRKASTLEAKRRRATVLAKMRSIFKFEIVLDKRKDPEDVQSALTNFRTDSIMSIREGTEGPKLKNYVDLHSEAYEPGDDVTGHINLMLTHPLTVKSIEAKLKGTYIVAFELRTEGESTTSTEQVTFLEEDALLPVGENHNGEPLGIGQYKFEFKFKLPLNIPSTMFFEKFSTLYEGASVVYSVEAVMNIEADEESFHSPVAKEIIEIVRRVPERAETEYNRSHKIVKPKRLSCCCIGMGDMSLAVTLPRLIYMEGETMLMEIRLTNDSSKKVKQVDIALVQYSSFKSKTLKGYVLKSRSSLLVHHVSMGNMGFGDSEHQIALTLPDEMQTSTMANIVPPTSFYSMHIPQEKELIGKQKVNQDNTNVNAQEDEEPLTVSPRDVKFDENVEEDALDDRLILLNNDWHMLFEIAYYIQVKVRTTSEWFNMKGPEIHFPITIEGADTGTRRKREMMRQLREEQEAPEVQITVGPAEQKEEKPTEDMEVPEIQITFGGEEKPSEDKEVMEVKPAENPAV